MNKYHVKLFAALNMNGPRAGEFTDLEDLELNDWLQYRAEDGYKLLSIEPVTYGGGLYILASMELVEEDAEVNTTSS